MTIWNSELEKVTEKSKDEIEKGESCSGEKGMVTKKSGGEEGSGGGKEDVGDLEVSGKFS